ncbi:hypothetical protein FRX31_017298 [Thalictrum thalictroides]|uniref:Uncharacterized protein n=1 Tax=Thalictrum thalictroides TaxID=46969 RepID=A0A7J6W9Q4_THATH|nr:hypothetical protein FRX31_017298 [Thalictrum thalictroides]
MSDARGPQDGVEIWRGDWGGRRSKEFVGESVSSMSSSSLKEVHFLMSSFPNQGYLYLFIPSFNMKHVGWNGNICRMHVGLKE